MAYEATKVFAIRKTKMQFTNKNTHSLRKDILQKHAVPSFSYPEPFLRAVRRGALAKSITGYHKNMVRKQCPVLELANQMPVRNMDLARAPRRTARKKGSGYENGSTVGSSFLLGAGNEGRRPEEIFKFRFSEMLFPVSSSKVYCRGVQIRSESDRIRSDF